MSTRAVNAADGGEAVGKVIHAPVAAGRKLVQLEALRGLASIIVVFHHLALAFVPDLKERFPRGVVRTPLSWLLNGQAAVIVFFVLSGFVLTRRYHEQKSGAVWIAVAKRFPRLVVPAGASILIGLCVLLFAPAWWEQAAPLTESNWLATFGHAHLPAGLEPSIASALKQIVLVFILDDNAYYNSNLWTMKPELLGSFLVLSYVAVLYRLPPRAAFWRAGLAVLLFAPVIWHKGVLLPFALGTLMAQFMPLVSARTGPRTGGVLMVGGLLLCCTASNYTLSLGAALIIFAVLSCEPIAQALSSKAMVLLGRISFPLYLVHTLVILTVGSYVYMASLQAMQARPLAILVASLVSIAVALLASLPFVSLDEWWVRTLNKLTKRSR